jgi:hypothetical protein
LSYTGTTIDPGEWPITLNPNQWNAIAFLGESPQDITTAFPEAVRSQIIMVQSSDGKVWIPDLAVNTIVNLLSGVGYQVAISGNTPLSFSYQITGSALTNAISNNVNSSNLNSISFKSISRLSRSSYFQSIPSTGLPFTIVISDLKLDGVNLPVGTEVGVFDGDLCVGTAIFNGETDLPVIAWKGASLPALSGFVTGRPMVFKVATVINDNLRYFTANPSFISGEGKFGQGIYSRVNLSIAPPKLQSVDVFNPTYSAAGHRIAVSVVSSAVDENQLQWLISEDLDTPLPTDNRWQSTKPTQFEFSDHVGEFKLAAWVKDPVGNINIFHSGAAKTLGRVFTVESSHTPGRKLIFGQWEGATAGYDPDLDHDQEEGLSNGSSLPYVFLTNTPADHENTTRRLLADFRPPQSISRWRLCIREGDPISASSLAFDIRELPANTCIFLQRLNHEIPVGDPIDVALHSFVPEVTSGDYELVYGVLSQVNVSFAGGWNLFSVPIMVAPEEIDMLTDTESQSLITGTLWAWTGKRFRAITDQLHVNPELAYWGFSPAGGSGRNVKGLAADGVISLKSGWNLIGPVVLCESPSAPKIRKPIWEWDPSTNSFRQVHENERLRPFHGYWIYANEDTMIELTPAQ